jgi:hypothetical protein
MITRHALKSLLHRLRVAVPARSRACQGTGAPKISRGTGARSRPFALLALPALVVASLAFTAAPALAAGDANEAFCPAETEASPGFRTYLPDCRAYEQVSPVFKEGFEASPERISEDGNHVILPSLGVFAGLEGGDTREGAFYELSRSASGWEVSPVSPPTSLFPQQTLKAESPDLSSTLFEARTASESAAADNFYLREANGTVLEAGPLNPPSVTTGPPAGEYDKFAYELNYYRDASSDLSHVIYRMATPLAHHGDEWPGDSTVGSESLLEYSGTGNTEPELVGVRPGPGEAKAKPSESPALVSTCGTSLGSLHSEDIYNAVSADGASVFFTAIAPPYECGSGVLGTGPEVNELYARLGGRETVPVSEPSAGACAACKTVVRAPAEFAGASEDGSRVFFTTEQVLLPGAAGPQLYEYDFDGPVGGRVVRVSSGSAAPEVQGVARVSEDGSHVYFVARGVLTSEADGSLPAGHQRALAGGDNLYVADTGTGRVSFIGMLCSDMEESGALGGVAECPSSETDASDWHASDNRPVQATPDGQFVVFESVADLTPGDTSVQPQVFEYDAVSGELVRVSRGASDDEPQGTESADANASLIEAQRYSEISTPAEAGTALAVSGDGGVVVFGSAGALTGGVVAATAREVSNGYEYRSAVGSGGSLAGGDVFLVSSAGRGVPQLDASGGDVFFDSPLSLVPQDTDSQIDIYDARVDGGFPGPVSPVECEGPACSGTSLAPPPLTASGSASVTGSGNLAPPPVVTPVVKPKPKPKSAKCKKGYAKNKKGKCVKQKPKKKAKSHKGTKS